MPGRNNQKLTSKRRPNTTPRLLPPDIKRPQVRLPLPPQRKRHPPLPHHTPRPCRRNHVRVLVHGAESLAAPSERALPRQQPGMYHVAAGRVPLDVVLDEFGALPCGLLSGVLDAALLDGVGRVGRA